MNQQCCPLGTGRDAPTWVQIYSRLGCLTPFRCDFMHNCEQDATICVEPIVKPQMMTPVPDVVRYRLRREGRIVGWMREELTGQRFYSREGLWWSGRKIKWTHRDRCCGLQDIDNRWLHEGDFVQPVGGSWFTRRKKWLILCSVDTGWTLVRSGLGGQVIVLSEQEANGILWRWSGFGWSLSV